MTVGFMLGSGLGTWFGFGLGSGLGTWLGSGLGSGLGLAQHRARLGHPGHELVPHREGTIKAQRVEPGRMRLWLGLGLGLGLGLSSGPALGLASLVTLA